MCCWRSRARRTRNSSCGVFSPSYEKYTTRPISARTGGISRPKDAEVRIFPTASSGSSRSCWALASDPKILLLDEPAAGLSSGEITETADFLVKLDPRLAIILIEHDMDVVFDVASEIPVLHFGEMLETGTPQQIYTQRQGAGNLSGDRLNHGGSRSPGYSYLLRRRLCSAGPIAKLEQGQILGPLGRNGVGKSTLVNSIVGFNPPRRGKVVFKGDDITEKFFRDRAQRLGLVPQGRRCFRPCM